MQRTPRGRPRIDGRSHRRQLEFLESRRMLDAAWGAAPRLIRLDEVDAVYPTRLGAGQTIAVVDTGIDYTHPSLGAGFGTDNPDHAVIGGYDFVDDDADPLDTHGHGTAVAGVIAARPFDVGGFTYRGVAPDARLVALRIAQTPEDIVPLSRLEQAFQWVLANNDTYHFTAVNLSFGVGRFETNFTDPTLSDELAQFADLGIAFVSSSGNGGTEDGFGITYPAADPNAISVGAVNTSDVITEFTQRSRNLDLLAPGENVRTLGLGGTFVNVAGTSFAAPAVAATVGLVREVDPTFTLGDIRSILRAANPANFDGDLETGATSNRTYQRLDVFATLALALRRQTVGTDQFWRIGLAGNENDLAFDREGVLHFAWYDNDARTARYATRSLSGRWSLPSNIDDARPDVGTEFSMKLDSYGRPVLAYLDGPWGDLKLGRLYGEGWHRQTIDDKGVTGLYPSLAIDGLDQLYISYFRKTTHDVKVAMFDTVQWSRQTIDNDGNVGWSSTIALDPQERPAVAYGDADRRQLKMMRLDEQGTWNKEVVDADTDGAAYLSVLFDAAGHPNVSYYEVQPADLKFASFDGFTWQINRLASKGATGLYTNLALDALGNPAILYWDKRTDSLMHATTVDGSRFSLGRVASGAGKYTMSTRSPLTGKWVYATNTGPRLVLGEI